MRLSLLALLMIAPLLATVAPAKANGDPRLRSIAYASDQVFTLRVATGQVATVILDPGERIESVAVGNSAAWEVTPNADANLLFVKPNAAQSTNAEVVTSARHYSFMLETAFPGDPGATLRLRFTYADQAEPGARSFKGELPASGSDAEPTGAPFALSLALGQYRVRGDRAARPLAVSDNGLETLFVFDTEQDMPAVYGEGEDGREVLITLRREEAGWVTDRLWPRYILRLGKATARADRQTR